jgi:L-fucose mutarotase
VKTIPIEAVAAPVPDDGSEPPIFPEYREILPKGLAIKKLQRFDFYDHVRSPNTALLIASGEKRTYACISLTIGLRSF